MPSGRVCIQQEEEDTEEACRVQGAGSRSRRNTDEKSTGGEREAYGKREGTGRGTRRRNALGGGQGELKGGGGGGEP